MTLESENVPSGFERVFDLDQRGERPMVALCNLILSEGLAAKATAISLVSVNEGCIVRFHVGEQCRAVMKIPSLAGPALINRLRVMANLDRTKGHNRQEGTVHARFHSDAVVFKVEVQPKPDGMEDAIVHCLQSYP